MVKKVVLDHPHIVNCRDLDGRHSTPLHFAAGYNRVGVVEFLLQHGKLFINFVYYRPFIFVTSCWICRFEFLLENKNNLFLIFKDQIIAACHFAWYKKAKLKIKRVKKAFLDHFHQDVFTLGIKNEKVPS